MFLQEHCSLDESNDEAEILLLIDNLAQPRAAATSFPSTVKVLGLKFMSSYFMHESTSV
jgi:hypothetical protein